jgi:hypothetical protein
MASNQFSPLSRAVHKMAMRKSTVAQWYLAEAENCFLKRLFGLCWPVPEFYPKYLKNLNVETFEIYCNRRPVWKQYTGTKCEMELRK